MTNEYTMHLKLLYLVGFFFCICGLFPAVYSGVSNTAAQVSSEMMAARAAWQTGNLLSEHFSWKFSFYLFFKGLQLKICIHEGEIDIKTATVPFAMALPWYIGDSASSFPP